MTLINLKKIKNQRNQVNQVQKKIGAVEYWNDGMVPACACPPATHRQARRHGVLG